MFKFKCYQKLKKTFGEVDAIVECIELSIRHFTDLAKKSSNCNEYIEKMGKNYDVKVTTVNFEDLENRASLLHLLNVYQQFELYLQKFRDEHPSSKEWKYNEEDPLFLRILDNLNNDPKIITDLEVQIIEYYRNIRNVFMHNEISKSKHDKIAKKLKVKLLKNDDLKKLDAVNVYKQINFDDFILFTRVVKVVAQKMCIMGRPSDEQIADIVKKDFDFKKLNKYLENKARMKQSIQNYIQSEFSMEFKESDNVSKIIELGVLAQR